MVDRISRAIAYMEGFFAEGSRAAANKNPGNLRTWGSRPVRGGYAVFPRAEDGWKALRTQIRRNITRGLTLREFFAGKPGIYPGYAPASDRNNPDQYARYVAGQTGIPVDKPLNQVLEASKG